MNEDRTTLAVSDAKGTVVEFKFNDSAGIMAFEASNVTLYYRKREDGRLTVVLAPKTLHRQFVVHDMKPGESVIYRVCPAQKAFRKTVEWQTFTAPAVPKRPLWQRWFNRF